MKLSDFDYSQNGTYFFTICTKNRRHNFGTIHGNYMALNTIGCIVWEQWYWLAQQYPYVILDAFIVMPNHVHGILIINHPEGVDRVLPPKADKEHTILALY